MDTELARHWERFEADPANDAAFGLLEAALQEAARSAPGAREPLRDLRRLYHARSSHAAVLQVAEIELVRIADPAERADLLLEMAAVWEQGFDDPDQARLLRARAVAERETAAPATEHRPRTRAYEAKPAEGTPQAPADEVEAGGGSDQSAVQRAWLAAARGDSHTAIETLNQALENAPGDVDALDMMVTVLEGAERHAETAEWLERRAALVPDAGTRSAVLTRLAAVREHHLGDLTGARSAYEQALEANPDAIAARLALIDLYRSTEAWARLRTLLEESVNTGLPEQRGEMLCDLAAVLEMQFEDTRAADEAYERALSLHPESRRAAQGLARLREEVLAGEESPQEQRPRAGQRAARIVGVLERKLERLAASGEELGSAALELRMRIAELRGSSLDDPAGAIATLEPAIESDDGLLLVAPLLADLYERAEQEEVLIEFATRVATQTGDPEERTSWLRRAAAAAQSAGHDERAADSWRRILDEHPCDPEAEAALTALYRAAGGVEPLIEMLRSQLARAEGERERALHLDVATQLELLRDCAGALGHLARAVELDPGDDDTLDRALALAGEVGDDLTQLDVLDQAVAAAPTPPIRARLMSRRASHLADALGWHEEAQAALRVALDTDPGCAAAPAQDAG